MAWRECFFRWRIGSITDPALGTNASTTGNITGIYDMSGGALESVMGNYNNTTNSYFPILPESKYYDVYLASQFIEIGYSNIELCTLETCGGHALLETANWYYKHTDFLGPWGYRSAYNNGSMQGIGLFLVFPNYGGDRSDGSWRSVLVVDR